MTPRHKTPTASVVTATYNGHRFIQHQLESLAAQSLRPDELLVCDDGSTDGTLNLVTDFQLHAPFPVRIYCNPVRLGYTDNFLHGYTLAGGELIALCDQDDVWAAGKLQRGVAGAADVLLPGYFIEIQAYLAKDEYRFGDAAAPSAIGEISIGKNSRLNQQQRVWQSGQFAPLP